MLMIRWWWEGAALVEISTVQAAPLFIFFFISFNLFIFYLFVQAAPLMEISAAKLILSQSLSRKTLTKVKQFVHLAISVVNLMLFHLESCFLS